jgi:hypothetical protein
MRKKLINLKKKTKLVFGNINDLFLSSSEQPGYRQETSESGPGTENIIYVERGPRFFTVVLIFPYLPLPLSYHK